MSIRYTLFGLFLFCCWIVIRRDPVKNVPQAFYPPEQPAKPYDQQTKQGYTIGPFSKHPYQPRNFLQRLNIKKIDSYIFDSYNLYKFEIAFIDLGYTSALQFNFMDQKYAIHHQQRLGLSLPTDEFFKDSLNWNFQKKNFNFSMNQHRNKQKNQVTTYFKLSFKRQSANVQFYASHIVNQNSCFTINRRPNILAHKCAGGIAQGRSNIRFYHEESKKNIWQNFNLNENITRVAYDGFKGVGSHWNYMWATSTGFNKQQHHQNNLTMATDRHFGLNFGTHAGQSEDFIFIDGDVLPVKEMYYHFKAEDLQKKTNITFASVPLEHDKNNPIFNFKFQVLHTQVMKKDAGIIMVNIIKAQGFWHGNITHNGKTQSFSHVVGSVQIGNCLF